MPTISRTPQHRIYEMIYNYGIYRMYADDMETKHKNPYWLNYDIYNRLIQRLHEKITDRLVYNAYQWKLPYRLGIIRIEKVKPEIIYDENGKIDYTKTKMKIDYRATRKYNKKSFYYNTHTKGYFMFFTWWKRHKNAARVKNISLYRLKVSKPVKRKLIQAIHELYVKGKIDFPETTRGKSKYKKNDTSEFEKHN
jgi:hypothetical protein